MQRLCSVLVALEGCDGVGDDGVGGEVLDTGGAVSHRAALLLGGGGRGVYIRRNLRPGTASNGPSRH